MANCSSPQQQYTDLQTCLTACASFPVGSLSDTSGDTLGCRAYHAMAAQQNPAVHCEHAGPLGGGQCGASECEGFCDIATDACPTQWPALATCTSACANFKNMEPFDVTDTAGNSLACRMYHLEAALSQPAAHCGHTVANSPTCQ